MPDYGYLKIEKVANTWNPVWKKSIGKYSI